MINNAFKSSVLVLVMCILSLLLVTSCKPKASNVEVSLNNTYRSQSEHSNIDHYAAYYSMCKFPYKTFYKAYNRMPTEAEYFNLLDMLPWEIPYGKDKIKWTSDITFPSKATMVTLDRDFLKTTISNIDLNPYSAATNTNCDGTKESFKERYKVNSEDHIHYLRYRFIHTMMSNAANIYVWQHNGNSPSSVVELEQILGLELKPSITYDRIGVSFDFQASPITIKYTNDKLPAELNEPSPLIVEKWMKNSKNIKLPTVVWP